MIHSSFEEDSFFTKDILENICRAEGAACSKEKAHRKLSIIKKPIKKSFIESDSSFSVSPEVSRTKSLHPKNSTPILARNTQALELFCDKTNIDKSSDRTSEIVKHFSQRLLNKKRDHGDSIFNISKKKWKENNKSTVSDSENVVIELKSSNCSNHLLKNDNSSLFSNQKIDSHKSVIATKVCSDESIKKPANSHYSLPETEVEQYNANSQNPVSDENQLNLSYWGLPEDVLNKYKKNGITKMFPWQVECLSLPGVLEGNNLVYSAPTSAGKTLVSEIILLKRVLEQSKKGIFILPFVSIAREKTFALKHLFGVVGVRVEGFMGGQSPPGGFQKTDIAICTIEKANNLINRLIEEDKIEDLGIIVVDELHMVGDPQRGYLLELLLTKLQYILAQKNNCFEIQIIGMSATLPNLHVLAEWLKAKLYSTTFRPIPLLQMVKIGSTLYNDHFSVIRKLGSSEMDIKDDTEHLIELCLETVIEGFSILLFCPTKAWCEKIALSIAFNFFSIGKENSEYPDRLVRGIRNRLNVEDLKRVIGSLRGCPAGLDPVLEKSLAFGTGFHHAGLTFDERDIIEGAFRAGYLPVLVATSTLSSGVNLPARRVIIRSLNSGGRPMDPLVYKQMIGRAGRKGKDTQGESILMCNINERLQAERLVMASLPPIISCLQKHSSLSNSMKRAILEIVISGAAKTTEELQLYWNRTLLAATVKEEVGVGDSNEDATKPAIEESVRYLIDNEFARYQECDGKTLLKGTQLGCAVLASGLSPDEGLHVFSELQKARRCFVLENELHVIYQVTPIYVSGSWPNLDWLRFLELWEVLTPDMKRVGELVGIEEGFISRAMKGTINTKVQKQKNLLAIHQRFYAALALQDLVHEVPLKSVVSKYGATKGLLQALQQSAATFAGMVTVFCNRLGWNNLELLISQYQNRLHFGVQRDLCNLVRISLLNGYRARLLFSSGLETVNQVAHSHPNVIENILTNSGPFQSTKDKGSRGFIVGPNGSPLSVIEASNAIVEEARSIIQKELGIENINWNEINKEKNLKKVGDVCSRTNSSVPNVSKNNSSVVTKGFTVSTEVLSNSKRYVPSNLCSEKLAKSRKFNELIDREVRDYNGVKKSENNSNFTPDSIENIAICSSSERKEIKISESINVLNKENNLEPHFNDNVLTTVAAEIGSKDNLLFPNLESKGSFSKAVSVGPVDVPKFEVRKDKMENDTGEIFNEPCRGGEKAELRKRIDNCSSASLSESLKAELLITMVDDSSRFSERENKNQTSVQSEDLFDIFSDKDEGSLIQDKDVSKMSSMNCLNSSQKMGRETESPIYAACAESIDFDFDLSKTETADCSTWRNSMGSLTDFNEAINEESLVVTESGVLSLTREHIEKDIADFESSVMGENSALSDSVLNRAIDSQFSIEEIERGAENEINSDVGSTSLEGNNIPDTVDTRFINYQPKDDSAFNDSSLIFSTETEAILDGKYSSFSRSKTEDIINESETENVEILKAETKFECNTSFDGSINQTLKICQGLQSSFNHSSIQNDKCLCIIDVTADERLFDVFIEEWRSKREFSISLACAKTPPESTKRGIGWRLGGRSRRTLQRKVSPGLEIEHSPLLLTGVAVSWGHTDAYFINLKTDKELQDDVSLKDYIFPTPPSSKDVPLEKRINTLKSILSSDLSGKIIHMWQVKENLKLLFRCGFEVGRASYRDPRVASWLLDPNAKERNICNLVLTFCEEYVHLLDNVGSTHGMESLGISHSETINASVRVRAATESVVIFHLNNALERNLSELHLHNSWEAIEMPSIYSLCLMELNGLGFSVSECYEQKVLMQEKLELLQEEAYRLAGRPFSLSSPDEISKILYLELHLGSTSEPNFKRSTVRRGSVPKRGRCIPGPTNKETLEKLKEKHPLPEVILQWRKINSALTKIVYPLCQEVISCSSLGGEDRIFPICNTFTATGRVTFHEPNIQTIPKDFFIEMPEQYFATRRKARKGSKYENMRAMQQLAPLLDPSDAVSSHKVSLRHTVVSGEGRLLLSADYSQIELRILAHLSMDDRLLSTLNGGEDVFKSVASQIYSIPVLDVDDNMRQKSKQICYGIIYGMSEKTLGDQLGLDERESVEFVSKFHRKFPGIRKFIAATIDAAKENGFVTTIGGRRRYLNGINSPSISVKGQCERQAVNTRIQGSAADIVKKALVKIQEKLRENFPSAPLSLTQHQEPNQTLSGAFLILQLHDELIYEVASDDVIQVAQIVRESMEHVLELSVALPVKIKIGPTWGTAQTLNL